MSPACGRRRRSPAAYCGPTGHTRPNRLVGDDDPAREQQLLHLAEGQREAVVQPHRMGDDLHREPEPLYDTTAPAPTANPSQTINKPHDHPNPKATSSS